MECPWVLIVSRRETPRCSKILLFTSMPTAAWQMSVNGYRHRRYCTVYRQRHSRAPKLNFRQAHQMCCLPYELQVQKRSLFCYARSCMFSWRTDLLLSKAQVHMFRSKMQSPNKTMASHDVQRINWKHISVYYSTDGNFWLPLPSIL